MAVADASWWGVWWPWLLVWGTTAALLVATVAIAVAHWRRDRDDDGDTRLHGSSFYLDDKEVMDLYQLYGGKYRAALSQEVQERSTSTREGEVSAELAQVLARAKRGVNDEVFRSYITEDEPITVIGIVIDVLDRADDIVDVDLLKKEITSNRALDKALGVDDDKRPTTVRLRALRKPSTFVSIFGEFRATDGSAPAVTTFEAPYGDPTDPADGPQVHFACTTSGLRRTDVPADSFPARCLGRVQNWDPGTRKLTVRPIAIFS